MDKVTEKAFIKAYDDFADDIFRFCVFRLYDRERAKDVMQDTFTRTWVYIQAGNQIQHLRAFLYKTARNLCVNEMVRSTAFSLDEMQEVAGYDPQDQVSETAEDIAEASVLMKHLAELDPSFQEVLTLRYINGLAVKEIGEILGQPPNTISVRIHRAVEELRKKMHV